ncbi:MAG: D-alanyl-D-alanine carboxypeptidase family protein [Gammaproteobacteria bacterium]
MPSKRSPGALLFALCALCTLPAVGSDLRPVPAPPDVKAENFLLVDFQSNDELAAREPDAPIEPASITKVMTAYVIFRELAAGNISLQDTVTISDHAWRKSMGTSRMFLEPRTQVSVEQLLQGMIRPSGKDASIALAEHVAGSEETFASLMNAYAAELGLQNSNWLNSTGLPDKGHYTTARDLVRLARAVISEFPDYYAWYSQPSYTYNGISQPNRNRLLGDSGVDGMKTGWTDSAGYCLLTSAQRDGRRLISVVLNSPSGRARVAASKALLNYGFRFYETHLLYGAGDEVTRQRVWKGSVEQVGIGLQQDLYLTVIRGRYEDLSAAMELQTPLMAPVSAEQSVGQLTVTLDGEAVAERPLFPLQTVEQGSLWQQLSDSVLMWFE